MAYRHIATGLFIIALVASCGRQPGERALSGAGVGAAAGAVGSALVGGAVVTGAAVGAAAGAIVGAVSDPNKIRLD